MTGRAIFSAAPLLVVLALSGCTSIERINQNMKSSEATDAKARQQMQKLTTPPSVLREAARQWVNPTLMMDRTTIKKATPPCTITINRQGSLSVHDVSERITRVCRLPVSVTPDALTLLGGVSGGQTQQMKGDIPPPDVNGMVPLAAIGMASSSAPAAVNTGANLNGLYWNGPLSGLLDTFDKEKYPKLAKCYPDGKLPDLRGEFIRGVDSSRSVLSSQKATEIRTAPLDYFGVDQTTSGSAIGTAFSSADTANKIIPENPKSPNNEDLKNTLADNIIFGTQTTSKSMWNSGAVWISMRPRNIAFNYIVKAA